MKTSLFTYNTMRLIGAPETSSWGTKTRQAWDALFETYGYGAFHPIEGRGVLCHVLQTTSRSELNDIMQRMIDRGFAIAP